MVLQPTHERAGEVPGRAAPSHSPTKLRGHKGATQETPRVGGIRVCHRDQGRCLIKAVTYFIGWVRTCGKAKRTEPDGNVPYLTQNKDA